MDHQWRKRLDMYGNRHRAVPKAREQGSNHVPHPQQKPPGAGDQSPAGRARRWSSGRQQRRGWRKARGGIGYAFWGCLYVFNEGTSGGVWSRWWKRALDWNECQSLLHAHCRSDTNNVRCGHLRGRREREKQDHQGRPRS